MSLSATTIVDRPNTDWPVYNGDSGGTRYAALDQINTINVDKLQIAWTYHTGDKHENPNSTIECNPIVVDGVMYVTSPQLKAIALDAATGRKIWSYEPFSAAEAGTSRLWMPAAGLVFAGVVLWAILYRRARLRRKRTSKLAYTRAVGLLVISVGSVSPFVTALDKVLFRVSPDLFERQFDPWRVNRGVTYWEDGDDRRILYVAGHNLVALRAQTGEVIQSFGDNGQVDLRNGLDREVTHTNFLVTSPGVVYRDLLVLGSKTGEGPRPEAPGHIRAYDIRTGKRRWIFHTIPHPGEFGHETWGADSWKKAAGANDWAGMTVDQKRGLVFAATGSPTFDFYGGDRPGQNLFGDSVIALDAATGQRVWHYQIVHHNLWDYDLPCPPQLVTIHRDGRPVDAVVQLTKMGNTFVLNRDTGTPLFPVEERPVPASDVPGERTWPTQPFPLMPPPFVRQTFREEDLTDISPEAHAYALQQFRRYRTGGMFVPPSLQGTLETPGIHGGANWSGGSFDPATSRLYVNSNEVPYVVSLTKSKFWATYPYDHTGYRKFLDQNGYPAIKPPWGRLTAIDLDKGELVWQVPLGSYPELIARGLPPTGSENFGGSLVTAGGLVFVGATLDQNFRAFDKRDGRLLWETKLEAGGYATPSTYQINGRQFVVIAAGGGGQFGTTPGDAFVAFALPETR